MENWLKEHWFKAGILSAILITAFAFYNALVIRPNEEIAREEAERIEAKLAEEQRKEQLKIDLASCLAQAQTNYSSNWFNACKDRGLLSQWCIETEDLDFQAYLKKLGISEEEYKKQRNITDDNTLSAILDYHSRKDDCSCSLPLALADRWDKSSKDDEDRCYEQYPQN